MAGVGDLVAGYAAGHEPPRNLREMRARLGVAGTIRELGDNPRTGRPYSRRTVERFAHEPGEINPRTGRPFQTREMGPDLERSFNRAAARLDIPRGPVRIVFTDPRIQVTFNGRDYPATTRNVARSNVIPESRWRIARRAMESGDPGQAERALREAFADAYDIPRNGDGSPSFTIVSAGGIEIEPA